MAAFLKSKGITHIKNTSGELVDIDTINTNKIGLYFSAHWVSIAKNYLFFAYRTIFISLYFFSLIVSTMSYLYSSTK